MFRKKAWPLMLTVGACVALAGCGQRKVADAKGKGTPPASTPGPGGVAITNNGAGSIKLSNTGAVAVASAKGTVLVQDAGKFSVADKGAQIAPGQSVVSAGGAVLMSGGVEAELLADLTGNDPMPVVTSGLTVLKPSEGIDFEFQLAPGRIDLENKKSSGPAKVRIHAAGHKHDLELVSPGARCAIETYGRLMPGAQFDPEASPENTLKPVGRGLLVVLKGEVAYSDHDTFMKMTEPPGRSLLNFDSKDGHEPVPSHLDKAPAWVLSDAKDPSAAKHLAMVKEIESKLAEKGEIAAVIDEYGSSDDPAKRIAAVHLAAAVGDLPRIFMTVNRSPHPDVVDEAIVAIRHWLGSGPNRAKAMYDFLLKGIPELMEKTGGKQGRPATPAQAVILIDLFIGFTEEQKVQPSTYKYLLKLLSNERSAIRGVASWYLNHLVPDGVRFGFNPNDPEEARAKSVKQWETRLTELKLLPVAAPAPKVPAAPKKP
ncbi:MAG: hypothetical protein ACKOS8_04775 [Gemmataceae bacterium]